MYILFEYEKYIIIQSTMELIISKVNVYLLILFRYHSIIVFFIMIKIRYGRVSI